MPRAIMPSTAPPTAAVIAIAITTGASISTSHPARAPEVDDRCCGGHLGGNGDIDRWAGRGRRRTPVTLGRAADAAHSNLGTAYYGRPGRAGNRLRTGCGRVTGGSIGRYPVLRVASRDPAGGPRPHPDTSNARPGAAGLTDPAGSTVSRDGSHGAEARANERGEVGGDRGHRGRSGGPPDELASPTGWPRACRPRSSFDARRRLAGSVGRVPPRRPELDGLDAGLRLPRQRAGRVHGSRRADRPLPHVCRGDRALRSSSRRTSSGWRLTTERRRPASGSRRAAARSTPAP